ncbi:phospholipase D family protein [Erwinia amylovora]
MRKHLPYMMLMAALSGMPALSTVAAPGVAVGFSPEGSAEQLVLSTLNDARESIRLMGYSFTSPEVVSALMAAKLRGVDVRVVLDEKANHGRISQWAMKLLAGAKIPLRTVNAFPIMHDKFFVVDGCTVETGSLNFTRSGERFNSENVIVLNDMPDVAQRYLTHWQSRWALGTDWPPAQ